MSIYEKVATEFGTCDVTLAQKPLLYKISASYYDILSGLHMDEGRLGHSHNINGEMKSCTEFTSLDEVNCYYLFGETILHTTHKVGQCPWKTGIYAIQSEE